MKNLFFSLQASKKRKTPDLAESSVIEMSKALSSYIGKKNESDGKKETNPTLKFGYIWQNLDNLFQQMAQEDVNELNLNFITMAVAKINDKK